jgi:hypothetical protein
LDREVALWRLNLVVLSYKTYEYWRHQNHVFEELAGLAETNSGWTLTRRGEPAVLMGTLIRHATMVGRSHSPCHHHARRAAKEEDL